MRPYSSIEISAIIETLRSFQSRIKSCSLNFPLLNLTIFPTSSRQDSSNFPPERATNKSITVSKTVSRETDIDNNSLCLLVSRLDCFFFIDFPWFRFTSRRDGLLFVPSENFRLQFRVIMYQSKNEAMRHSFSYMQPHFSKMLRETIQYSMME